MHCENHKVKKWGVLASKYTHIASTDGNRYTGSLSGPRPCLHLFSLCPYLTGTLPNTSSYEQFHGNQLSARPGSSSAPPPNGGHLDLGKRPHPGAPGKCIEFNDNESNTSAQKRTENNDTDCAAGVQQCSQNPETCPIYKERLNDCLGRKRMVSLPTQSWNKIQGIWHKYTPYVKANWKQNCSKF